MRLPSFFILLFLCAWPAAADCGGRTITRHVMQAPICVPGEPKRVVVLDPFYNLGMALELGVPVVGAPLFTAPDAGLRARAEAASIVDIGDTRQPDLERIVALQPDLILGDGQLHGQFYGKLARIAPTALIDVADWKDYLLTLGDVTGRSDKAAEALRAFGERASAIRARMPEGIEVSVIRVATHGFHVYLDGPAAYAPYAVLHEAGVKRTAYETTDGDAVLKRPTWEEIGELNGRILLYVVAAGNMPGQDDDLEAETIGNPLWKMLPAVQAGRAYRVDKAAWFGFNSVASAHRILDDVERYILTAP
ncbi:iron-siderophore ABC transporter substrate-binding protein [Shinella sp.]|uniref:iron-siderophore ABC transporter substrate-binding protein n=1 Tax=Shinella sp. TaxID=1870904 RepID=UPI00301BD6A2